MSLADRPGLSGPVLRIEQATALDRPAGAVRDLVRRVLRNRTVKDALHGVWLGHPLHPALAQLSMGSLLSASLIDAAGGGRRESSGLIGVGLAAAVPTAAAGWADYAEGHEEQQRVGLVHAVVNIAALTCYARALLTRRHGRSGRLMSLAGAGLSGLGAALGGHLGYRLASGANHGEEVQHVGPASWRPLGELNALPVGEPVRRMAGDVPVFVLRRPSGELTVLSDRCPHLSAPLHEGALHGGGRNGSASDELTVTCPWHASVFRVCDGGVVHGPATAPVPAFDSRVRGGVVEVRVRTLPGISAS
jgi:nitrite reductase/ring-hydroxylating ferredoxin subunit